MSTLLAIDASTVSIGWAVFVGGEYRESGVFNPQGDDAWNRIEQYEEWLSRWWRGFCLLLPDIIAYELATGRHGNARTDRLLGGLEYATRRNWFNYGRLIIVTASQVRASGCHKKALHYASAITGKEITSGDEADAIGVALAALAKMGENLTAESG